MANVKVKVIDGVVNGNPVGSELSVADSDFKWLAERGYVEKIETKSKPKSKPKKEDVEDSDKGEDTE